MRKISMPGFTGALSLGPSAQRYGSTRAASLKRGAMAVVPSLFYKATLSPTEASELCRPPCRVIDGVCNCPHHFLVG